MPNTTWTSVDTSTEQTLPTPIIQSSWFKPVTAPYPNTLPLYTVEQYDAAKMLGYMIIYSTEFECKHAWFNRERDKYRLHPVIKAALKLTWPANVQTLIEQWPHVSVEDANRLAYTRSHEHGVADRQTVTSVGKYLRQHFPTLKDHDLRGLTALYAGNDEFKIVTMMDGKDGMLDLLYRGPDSCMRDDSEEEAFCPEHPYRAYDPQYGWGLAVRMRGNAVMGRALINKVEEDHRKIFVRSYARIEGSLRSETDHALETWLKGNGYARANSWEGCRLAKVRRDNLHYHNFEYSVPYIDGSCQTVSERMNYLIIENGGEWLCNNTNGDADNHGMECPCCGSRVHEDDMVGVGVYCDDSVCNNCIMDSYASVYGRRGEEYYIPNDYIVEADGCMYDPDYLSDNDIVELHNGDYTHLDNAVYIESADAYYLADSIDIVYAQDTEAYELREDCWQCNQSDMWYTNEVDYVEVDGDTYHPDNAPEVETN